MTNNEKLEKVFDKIDNTNEELTDEEIDALCEWVEEEVEKLNG